MTPVVQSALLGRRERLWPVVMVSAVVHVALVGLAVLERPPPLVDLQQKPIVAKLVRLGEKRPEAWLPRNPTAAAPPAPAPAPVAKAEPAHPPAPAPAPAPARPAPKAAEAPRPRTAADRSHSGGDVLSSVLSKVRREQASEPTYGDPNGDPMGDSDEASAGDQYLALVQRALRDSYILPATISDRERMHLRATVLLFVDTEGQVLRYSFESRSGNDAFDAALERAIRAARLPPPPAELRRKYRTEGLGVIYTP